MQDLWDTTKRQNMNHEQRKRRGTAKDIENIFNKITENFPKHGEEMDFQVWETYKSPERP
jgi:hypothetical protein